MFRNQSRVSVYSELLRIGRFTPYQLKARDSSAFLVDRDDRFDLRKIAQVIDQLTELKRGLDVAPEQNVTTRLRSLEKLGRLRIQFISRDTDKQKLT